jgi:aminoglycoside phosphotransferase (APT) family kinase protein
MTRRSQLDEVRDVVLGHLPGYRVDSVVRLGEGLDNVSYEVNGELIVRFSKQPDPVRRAAQVSREAHLLATVAGISPLPVPEPRFAVPDRGWLAYGKIPGRPLLDLPEPHRRAHAASIATALGEFLSALHAVPLDQLADLPDTDNQPLGEWLEESTASYPAVADLVPAAHRQAVAAFLDSAPPPGDYTLVFSHNDLGIEHVLVDPHHWTVTGVIDWSDAAIVDPAYDFGLLHRDLGATALRAALAAYRIDLNDLTALAERATFYARCSIFEDLAYGVETGKDEYVKKSLTAMEWLFPTPPPLSS